MWNLLSTTHSVKLRISVKANLTVVQTLSMAQEVTIRPGMLVIALLVKLLSSSLLLIVTLVRVVKQTVLTPCVDLKTNRDLSVALLFALIFPSRCGDQSLITTIMEMNLRQLIWCTLQQPLKLASQRWTFSRWGTDMKLEICLRKLVTHSRPASSTLSTTRLKRWASQLTTAWVWEHSYKPCKFTTTWIEMPKLKRLVNERYKRKVNV